MVEASSAAGPEPAAQPSRQHEAASTSQGQQSPGPGGGKYRPAGFFSKLTYTYVKPLLRRCREEGGFSDETDVAWMLPPRFSAANLGRQFEMAFQDAQARHPAAAAAAGREGSLLCATTIAMLRLHSVDLILRAVGVTLELVLRLLQPVILYQLLDWLSRAWAAKQGHGTSRVAQPLAPPVHQGWLLAAAFGASCYVMAFIRVQQLWLGLMTGIAMRQQVIIAMHAKALRLTRSAMAAAGSIGFITNLAANDARRFDEASTRWPYLWAGPVELVAVLLMVAYVLGIVPAIAGVGLLLSVVPVQAYVSHLTAQVRIRISKSTDQRICQIGEAVQGILAMKMLGWEDSFVDRLKRSRAKEEGHLRHMAYVKAFNSALEMCVSPLVAFVTLLAYVLLGGTLSVAKVFYALTLLNLPKMSLLKNFVLAVGALSEVRISVVRIDRFLSTPEPPPVLVLEVAPAQAAAGGDDEGGDSSTNMEAQSAPQQADSRSTTPRAVELSESPRFASMAAVAASSAAAQQHSGKATSAACREDAAAPADTLGRYAVELRGADFHWGESQGYRAQQEPPPSSQVAQATAQSRPRPSWRWWRRPANVLSAPLLDSALHTSSSVAAPSSTVLTILGSDADAASPRAPPARTLHGMRLSIPVGQLVGITGSTGAGKSSLLYALLGELQPLAPLQAADADYGVVGKLSAVQQCQPAATGSSVGADASTPPPSCMAVQPPADGMAVVVDQCPDSTAAATAQSPDAGSVLHTLGPVLRGQPAFCAQAPWIFAGTVRANILFGCRFEEGWYQQVVHACCLDEDLRELPMGDATEIGERGINLSGGQKARVCLARAIYSRAPILLLDDPLSAVDPRVARRLMDRALGPNGVARHATRLLVTHQRQFLPECDLVVVVRAGRIVAAGTFVHTSSLALEELQGGTVHMAPAGSSSGSGSSGGGTSEQLGLEEQAQDADEALIPPTPALQPASLDDASWAAGSPQDGSTEEGGDSSQPDLLQLAAGGRPATPCSDGDTSHDDDDGSTSLAPAPLPSLPTLRTTASVRHAASSRLRHSSGPPAQPPMDASTSPLEAGGSLPGAAAPPPQPLAAADTDISGAASSAALESPLFSGQLSSASADVKPTPSATSGKLLYQRWMGRIRARRLAGQGLAGSLGSSGSIAGPQGSSCSTGLTAGGQGSHKLVIVEDRETGSVAWSTYAQYCGYIGVVMCIAIAVTMASGQAADMVANWWLSRWAEAPRKQQASDKWLGVAGGLIGAVTVLAFVRAWLVFGSSVNALTRLHNSMLLCVMRAPLIFFHTNPTGRIVNRFSKDLGQADDTLSRRYYDVMQAGLQVLGSFVLVAIVLPYMLPVIALLGLVFYLNWVQYEPAGGELKRWEGVTSSPILTFFSATLQGLTTIRAFNAGEASCKKFEGYLTINTSWNFAVLSAMRWIGFKLDLLGATMLTAACLLGVLTRDHLSPQLMGMVLLYILQTTGVLALLMINVAEVESSMTSVERMLAYTRLPQEGPRSGDPDVVLPPPGWPRSGAITFERVTAVYRPGLPAGLQDVSFHIPGGCSCGLVGRTGSGKSTLMLALFRLLDVTHGCIRLDGVDVARLGVDVLRRQLSVIPQDPVLFSGTIRSNLDPSGKHAEDDPHLWSVLATVQLETVVRGMPGGLEAGMHEAGDNFSVGQKQLFCLARALLQNTRVLAIDEATANVDGATDALVQGAMHRFVYGPEGQAAGRTLLVIAHRMATIVGCERLLVLAGGKLQEEGSPEELMARKDGMFASMVAAAKQGSKKKASQL